MRKGNENDEKEKLIVNASPNPSPAYFFLAIKGKNNQPLALRVLDATGRAIEVMTNIAANGNVRVGENYKPGFYIAQVIQGSQIVMLKLIKSAR